MLENLINEFFEAGRARRPVTSLECRCPASSSWNTAWDGVHWDLMLETEPGGPLRTWAIDAPIVAGKDLPARALARPPAGLPRLRGRDLGRAGDGPEARPGGVSSAWNGPTIGSGCGWRGLSSSARSSCAGRAAGESAGRPAALDLPPGELRLKHLAGRQGRRADDAAGRGRNGRRGGSGRRGCRSVRASRRRGRRAGCSGSRRRGTPPRASSGRRAPAPWACSVIRSRTCSAGTGSIPARIFSKVSSRTFGSGTRGRATTQITERTGPWSSPKARVTRSISNRTRGSWTSGGSWSAKWVTRSSASQALTSSSLKTASQVGSLQMSLRSWRLCATNRLASFSRSPAGPLDHLAVEARLVGQREPGQAGDGSPGPRPRGRPGRARACSECAWVDLLPSGTGKGRTGTRRVRRRGDPVEPGVPRPVPARVGLGEVSNHFEGYDRESPRVNPNRRPRRAPRHVRPSGADHARRRRRPCGRRRRLVDRPGGPIVEGSRARRGIRTPMPSRLVCVALLAYWLVAAFGLVSRDLLPELSVGSPPDLRTIAVAGEDAPPARWSIQVVDNPTDPDARRSVGQAVTESRRGRDGWVEMSSQVTFDSGRLLARLAKGASSPRGGRRPDRVRQHVPDRPLGQPPVVPRRGPDAGPRRATSGGSTAGSRGRPWRSSRRAPCRS